LKTKFGNLRIFSGNGFFRFFWRWLEVIWEARNWNGFSWKTYSSDYNFAAKTFYNLIM